MIEDYRRLRNIEVTSVSRKDSDGWVGISTAAHGQLRCKAIHKTKLKLRKGWKGPLTVGTYVSKNEFHGATVVAYDQFAHQGGVQSHWNILDPNRFSLEHYGFIYGITNLTNGKKYIGRRFFKSGNWKTYTSSSTSLNNDIISLGKESFKFDIWYTEKTRSWVMYMECKEQYDKDVLIERDDEGVRTYYNRSIPAIRFIPSRER